MTNAVNHAETIKAISRGIDNRIAFEEQTQGGLKTIKALERLLKRADRLDHYTLTFIEQNGIDFDSYVNSAKQDGSRANIYSITKLWEASRILQGAKFDDMESNDHATLAATLVGLHEGNFNQKRLEFRINDLMTGIRRFQMFESSKYRSYLESYMLTGRAYEYGAGNTQGGSSLRALEALGIVQEAGREGTCKVWTFKEDSDLIKSLVSKAYLALASCMFATEQDSNFVKGTETCPAIPESLKLSFPASYVAKEEKQEDSNALNAAREGILNALAMMQADSDGMGQAIASVPEVKEEETTRAPINILDKEAMAKEAARQKKEKQEKANAKRKATLAAKKAAQESLSV